MADQLDLSGLDPSVAAAFQSLAQSAGANPHALDQLAQKYDPSAGGGTLQFGPWDTGIKTPQWLDRTLSGVGQGMTDVVRHAGNLVGLESNQDLANSKALDQPLLDTTAGKVGSFVGQTAITAPLMGGAGTGLAHAGALGAKLAASPLASGIAQGAGQGFLMADTGQKLQGTLAGGLLGGALPMLGNGLSKVAAGLSRTPEAQTLLDAGVSLTPGQLKPSGFTSYVEQQAEGIPFLGGAVKNAREGAMDDYTRAIANRSMAPGASLSPAARSINDMVAEAKGSFDTAYDAAKGFPVGAKIMSAQGSDIPLTQSFKQIANRSRPGMTSAERQSVGDQLMDHLQETLRAAKQSGQGLQSEDLLNLRSIIRTISRTKDGQPLSRASQGMLKDAETAVTQSLESQIPADASAAVRATDPQYAKFKVLEDIAARAKDRPGGPTPFQVSQAIAEGTPKGVYTVGEGANRDLSQAAMSTFQQTVPKTGFSALGQKIISPLTVPSALLAATKTGRQWAAGQLPFQRGINSAVDQMWSGVSPQTKQELLELAARYPRAALGNAVLTPRVQQMPDKQEAQ